MRAESGATHHAWVPVYAGTDQLWYRGQEKLEHLDEFNAHRLGNQLGSLLEEGIRHEVLRAWPPKCRAPSPVCRSRSTSWLSGPCPSQGLVRTSE